MLIKTELQKFGVSLVQIADDGQEARFYSPKNISSSVENMLNQMGLEYTIDSGSFMDFFIVKLLNHQNKLGITNHETNNHD